jgi:hypothetical protein
MYLQYTALQSLHSDTFRHDDAIFREYTPSLKPIKVNWITFINFIAINTSCCQYHLVCRKNM